MSSPNTSSGSLILDVTSTSSDHPESPLDVLSRAATMVESVVTSPVNMECVTSPRNGYNDTDCEQIPSLKERTHPKFRKSTTPEYLTAPDQMHHKLPSQQNSNEISSQMDQPLDMSVKKIRSDSPPPPPPYKYTPLRRNSPPRLEAPASLQHYLHPPPPYPRKSHLSSPPDATLPPPPSYESSTRGKKMVLAPDSTTPPIGMPVSKTADRCESPPRTTIREITIITADSSADPLLDEHFRRSLGANYKNLFKKDFNSIKAISPSRSPPLMSSSPRPDSKRTRIDETAMNRTERTKDAVNIFEEDMMQGYTVEDHFAKALGDTWLKLQAQKKAETESAAGETRNKTKILAL